MEDIGTQVLIGRIDKELSMPPTAKLCDAHDRRINLLLECEKYRLLNDQESRRTQDKRSGFIAGVVSIIGAALATALQWIQR
jgi:hypothetical protein